MVPLTAVARPAERRPPHILVFVPKVIRYALMSAALLLAGAGAYYLGGRLSPAPPLAGSAFEQPVLVTGLELIDQHGAAVDLAADFAGDLTLVFFGYTRCPDVCPLTLQRLARFHQDVGAPEDLNIVMVTVDPAHDTPAVLGAYVAAFDERFIGLTGSNNQVAEAARAFYIGYAGSGAQQIHTDVVAVVDRQSRLRYIYSQGAVPRLGEDLPTLLRTL